MSASTNDQPVGLSLRANFSWTFIGNIIYAACQWGILVVLAKLGSPEMVGQFALGLALTAPVIMFANLQLRAIQSTDAKNEYNLGDYLRLRLLTTTLALFVIIGIVVAAGYQWETKRVILVIGLAKAFESISEIFYGQLQRHESMDRIAISMIIKGIGSLIVLSLAIFLTHSVFIGTLGLSITWFVILVSYDIQSGKLTLQTMPQSVPVAANYIPATDVRPVEQQSPLHLNKLARLAWLALPLGFVLMLISLNSALPRYFLERYLGEHELGIFAALAYLQTAGTTVVSALGQSATPRLSKYYLARNVTAFRALLLKIVGIGVLLGLGGILVAVIAGKDLLKLLYQQEYARQDVLIWIMIAAGISYIGSFLGYAVTAARCFWIQTPLFIVATIVTAVSCVWLIPSYGVIGAAIALTLSATISVIGCFLVTIYALRELKMQGQQENPHE